MVQLPTDPCGCPLVDLMGIDEKFECVPGSLHEIGKVGGGRLLVALDPGEIGLEPALRGPLPRVCCTICRTRTFLSRQSQSDP